MTFLPVTWTPGCHQADEKLYNGLFATKEGVILFLFKANTKQFYEQGFKWQETERTKIVRQSNKRKKKIKKKKRERW